MNVAICPFCALKNEYDRHDVAPLPEEIPEGSPLPTASAYIACAGCGGTIAVPVPEEGIVPTVADEGL